MSKTVICNHTLRYIAAWTIVSPPGYNTCPSFIIYILIHILANTIQPLSSIIVKRCHLSSSHHHHHHHHHHHTSPFATAPFTYNDNIPSPPVRVAIPHSHLRLHHSPRPRPLRWCRACLLYRPSQPFLDQISPHQHGQAEPNASLHTHVCAVHATVAFDAAISTLFTTECRW
jgi:hypothetical protein